MAKKNKGTFHRTIELTLFNEWQKQRRMNDALELVYFFNERGKKVSRPTIERGLIYGHVNQKVLIEGITEFFKNRVNAEKQAAKELKALSAGD